MPFLLHAGLNGRINGMEMVLVTSLRRTVASSQIDCTSCHQQRYLGTKSLLLQQNSPVSAGVLSNALHVVVYNCHKTVVVVVVVVVG